MSEVLRYLIQKTPIGTMMKPNPEGNWIAAKDFDRVTAERDALQALLTAADERAGELLIMLRMAWVDTEVSAENCRRIDAALKPAEVKCKTCNGTRIVSDGAMYCSSGGIPFECGPIECVKDCPDCSKP